MNREITIKKKTYILKDLGHGAYGRVYSGESKYGNEKYAIKEIDIQKINKIPTLKNMLKREIKIMERLSKKEYNYFVKMIDYEIVKKKN